MSLKDKVIFITGGSRGIGSAVCQKLAVDTDYHILINYQSNKAAAEETLAKVIAAGATGEIISFDVTDSEAVKAALTKWQDDNPEAIVRFLEQWEKGYDVVVAAVHGHALTHQAADRWRGFLVEPHGAGLRLALQLFG